ncbi:MarR family winged helix-turn-helix transcriptional regulator [Paraburkholderia phosphatilytica]|uniref:MarR family winged helix-turn-helix transcriptional regulator n=1 Tax=Paraburkholderia phosphatilytica TaxID=2282883 RepID=UPI000E502475|nr:MarR family winged helix-turn-helix transcriptional regulator [Paraburkholderia phosphatilytica]
MQVPPEDDCFAIRQAARYVSQIYDRHLAKAGLTTTQYSILGRLRRLGRLTTQQIATAMVMDRTSAVRAIQPLQRDGLVDSRVEGRRAMTIGLTAAGSARLELAGAHWIAAQDEFEQRFGAARAEALRHELLDMTRD